MTTFTDDFNRADGSPGANWTQVSGTWSIISQQLGSGNAGGTIILRATGAMTTSDHSVQVKIAATAAVSHGVWARGNSNISQGYLLRNDGSSWNIFSVVGGSFTSIGTYAAAAVAGDVVKLEVIGSSIKGYINGTLRISVTDTAVTTGTSVGIRAESTNALRFDDFTAADVTSGATGDAALAATATLASAGLRATAGSGALAATATLTTSGVRAAASSAALTGTVGLAAQGVRGTTGASSLTASATLTADGAVAHAGAATLTGAAGLTTSGQRATASDTALTTTAALTAAGQIDHPAATALAVTAGLAAQGQVDHSADAALTATATLAADSTTGTPPALGAAAVTAAGMLTAAGSRATAAATSLAATAALTAAGTIVSTHDDIDVTVGAPYSPWTVGAPRAQPWTAGEPEPSDWEVAAPW